MGAEIVEHDDVPEIIERGGLFYFSRGGKDIAAYRPTSMLLLKRRMDAAYKLWQGKCGAAVVPLPKHR